jgi:hypothetical protein
MTATGDEPTQPLSAADRPGVPEAPTEPLVAPHVPVADVTTAQMSTLAPAERPRGSGAKRLAIVGVVSVVAAIVAVLTIGGLQRGGVPAPAESTAPPAAPSPSTPADDPGPVVEEPAPVDPTPEEPAPTPEPTAPTEPPAEPTPEPTA